MIQSSILDNGEVKFLKMNSEMMVFLQQNKYLTGNS